MEKLHYSIHINAPKQKVWDTMLNDETYREWTKVFNPDGGSYFKGDWSGGTEMLFLGPDEGGTTSGMYSRIAENREPDFISIQHLGELRKDEKVPFPGLDANESIYENYTLVDSDGGTEVRIELDTNEEYKAMFEEMWPKALVDLKEIAER